MYLDLMLAGGTVEGQIVQGDGSGHEAVNAMEPVVIWGSPVTRLAAWLRFARWQHAMEQRQLGGTSNAPIAEDKEQLSQMPPLPTGSRPIKKGTSTYTNLNDS